MPSEAIDRFLGPWAVGGELHEPEPMPRGPVGVPDLVQGPREMVMDIGVIVVSGQCSLKRGDRQIELACF